MQPPNYLGIYIAKDHAAAVCLTFEGHSRKLAGCFYASIEQAENSGLDTLIARIAAACADRQLRFNDVAVALDCAMFMQHSIHSEFSDDRKITQTIRFDAEEALGTDASDVAIAFRTDSVDKTGSNLSVFTAPKQLLTELLSTLAANNLDPVSVEPDVNCLARFICHSPGSPGVAAADHSSFGLLSRRNGYLVTPVSSPWRGISPMPPAAMRTFLLGAAQNRNEMLARQLSMTAAMLGAAAPVSRVEVFDAAGSVSCDDIAKKLAAQTERFDITESAKLSPADLADCPDAVEFAIAYGAAIGRLDPPANVNWRSDFMPYQGKKLRMQSALKVLSIAAVLLTLALGVFGFMQTLQVKKYRLGVREKFAKDYSAFMFGQTMLKTPKEAVTHLNTALRRIKEAQKGSLSLSGGEAIAGRLTLVLQAFNKCASATGLNVDAVSITEKSMTISGDTSGVDSTLKLFDALKQTNLNVLQQRISSDPGGRSTFTVTVEPRKDNDAAERPQQSMSKQGRQ